MSEQLFRTTIGFEVEGKQVFVPVAGIPGDSGLSADEQALTNNAPIGSIASDTTSGVVYKKKTAGSGSDKWDELVDKAYVDNLIDARPWKDPARLKEDTAYASLALAEAAMNGGTVDGVAVSSGDEILYTAITGQAKTVFVITGTVGAGATLVPRGDVTPDDGDAILIQEGTSQDRQYAYTGTNWASISADNQAELGHIRTFIGKSGTGVESPTYTSQVHITNGDNLEVAAGKLDAAVASNDTDIGNIQTEVNNLETAHGTMINTDGTFNNTALDGGAYMDAATNTTDALLALDSQLQTVTGWGDHGAEGYMKDLTDDLSPQLAADLDTAGFDIISVGARLDVISKGGWEWQVESEPLLSGALNSGQGTIQTGYIGASATASRSGDLHASTGPNLRNDGGIAATGTIRMGTGNVLGNTLTGATSGDVIIQTGRGYTHAGDIWLKPGTDTGDESDNGVVWISHNDTVNTLAPELRFMGKSGLSNYVGFKADDNQSGNQTYTWPTGYPAANNYLLEAQTDGTLAWVAPPSGSLAGLSDTTIAGAATGDVLYYDGNASAWKNLGVGTDNYALVADSSVTNVGVAWKKVVLNPMVENLITDGWHLYSGVDGETKDLFVKSVDNSTSANSTGDVWYGSGSIYGSGTGGGTGQLTLSTGNNSINLAGARNSGAMQIATGDANGALATGSSGNLTIQTGKASTFGGFIRLRPGYDSGDESDNGSIQFQLNGSGSLTNSVETRWYEGGFQNQYIALRAPVAVTTNRIWTLPDDDPTAVDGYFLTTDSNGVLSFGMPTGLTTYISDPTGTGTSVTLDSVKVDDVRAVKWIITAQQGTNVYAGEVLAVHDGDAADAINVDFSVYAVQQVGTIAGIDVLVQLNGLTGTNQEMELVCSSTASTEWHAVAIEIRE